MDPPGSPGFRARHVGGGGAFTTVDIGRAGGGGGMSNGLSPVPHSDPDRSPKGSASDRERRGGGMPPTIFPAFEYAVPAAQRRQACPSSLLWLDV